MNKKKIISFILNAPQKSLLFSFFILALTLPGVLFLKSDFSYRLWYDQEDPLLKNYDQYEKEFGNDDNIIIAIKHAPGIFNKKTLSLIHTLTLDIQSFEETDFVDSLSTFITIEGDQKTISLNPLYDPNQIDLYTSKDLKDIQKKAQSQYFSKGRLIDPSSQVTLIEAMMTPTKGQNIDYGPFVIKLRAHLKKFQEKFPDHEFHLLGNAQIAFLFKEIVEKDISYLFPLLFILFTLTLSFLLGRKSFIPIVYLTIICSILSMLGLMGYLGFKITSITSIAPQMLMTIALADLIHLLSTYTYARKKDKTLKEGLVLSLEKNFSPTLLTTLTTAGGLLSFTFAKVQTVSQLGVVASLGVLMAWFYSFFLFPPLLLILEKKYPRPFKKEPSIFPSFNLWPFLKKHHLSLIVGSTVIGLLSLYQCFQLTIDMNPIHQFKKENRFRKSHDLIKKHFGLSSSLEIVFQSPSGQKATSPLFLKKMEQFNSWALNQNFVVKSFSLLDILKILNKSFHEEKETFYKVPHESKAVSSLLLFYRMGLSSEHNPNRFINFDDNIVRMTLLTTLESSKEGLLAISLLNQKMKDLQLKGHVTGKIPLFHELTPYVFQTFFKSFLMALFIISLILMISLKSLTLGFMGLIPNLFPLLIMGPLYYLFNIPLDMGSALIASFCLGISVDDTIHFLFDYQRNKERKIPIKENLQMIMSQTYPPLFKTSLVLIIGFGSFCIADYIPNIKFGVMVAFILLAALFADFFILPGLFLLRENKSSK